MASSPSATTSPRSAGLLRGESLLALALLAAVAVMLFPLPSLLLDLLLALNLGLTVLLLLVTLASRRATDFSVFPSLLLLLSLYRLSLNVATTRLILLSGDAGAIVSAFGQLVVGGNLVVGLVIFLILVVIQFVVITKGAGRISEVAARFTLDALPGKQMAIDAELNAGAIDDAEARRRRRQLSAETEFYGAMDGAGKFVRGDAIAGLIITAINLVGGILIGLTTGLSLQESVTTYSILTIGDGLVSQIPALIVATTAGILTTKANSEDDLGREIGSQLFQSDRPWWIGTGLLAVLSLLPGLPTVPLLACAGAGLWGLSRRRRPPAMPAGADASAERSSSPCELDEGAQLREFLLTDRAILEIGPAVATLLHSTHARPLPERITALRREFSQSQGLWIPPIRIRASLQLPGEQYRILIAGREVASGVLRLEKRLAILPEHKSVTLPGESTQEPVFGLPARWIDAAHARQAEAQGCTVVDPPSVLLTHLGEMLQQHGHELLTRESLKQMLEAVKEFAPTVVDEIRSETLRMGMLHQVLVQLAEDRVSLSDLALVLEALLNHAPQKKSADDLVEAVREELGHLVCARYQDAEANLKVIALHPQLEARLRESIQEGQLALSAAALERLVERVAVEWRKTRNDPAPAAFLTHHSLRRPVRRVLKRAAPGMGFIAYREIPSDMRIAPLAILKPEEVFEESLSAVPAEQPLRTSGVTKAAA